MAIIKETGVGDPLANVYADATDLDNYALLRGEDLSAYDTTQKEAALYISAQDFVDGKHCFKGEKLNADQGMSLPTDEISLPNVDIVNANCNTAILQLKGLLFVQSSVEDKNGDVTKVRDKLDKLESETEYAEGTAIAGGTYDTTVADNMLKAYLCYGGTIQLLRV